MCERFLACWLLAAGSCRLTERLQNSVRTVVACFASAADKATPNCYASALHMAAAALLFGSPEFARNRSAALSSRWLPGSQDGTETVRAIKRQQQ